MMGDWSRRKLLRVGAATAGLGGTGALAGCNDLTGDSGGDDDTESTETGTPGSDTGTDGVTGYGAWLPAPSAFGGMDHYYSRYEDYETIQANEAEFDDEVYSRYEERLPITALDIPMADIETAITIEPVSSEDPAVLRGDFDVDGIAETLTDRGIEEDRQLGDYTLYRPTSGEGAVAMTSDTMLFLYEDDATVATLEAVINARNGETETYAEVNEDMRDLLDRLDGGTFVSAETEERITQTDPSNGEFEGQVGFGYQDTVTGETTETKLVVLFESADDVDMDAIDRYTEQDFFGDYRDFTTRQAGRSVVVTTEVDTTDLYTGP